jgi:hypothetical protein
MNNSRGERYEKSSCTSDCNLLPVTSPFREAGAVTSGIYRILSSSRARRVNGIDIRPMKLMAGIA